jgi:hypothetical protein
MNAKGKMRRWWWVGVIAAVLLMRLGWGWWVERNVETIVEDCRRRGDPVTVAEIRHDWPPPGEDAWFAVEKRGRRAAIVAARPHTAAWGC